MDDALAGTRVLIAGGDGDAARDLGARLRSGAAQVTVAVDAEAAAQAALTGSPDVIVALGAAEGELRDLLDPLDLRSGPRSYPGARSGDEELWERGPRSGDVANAAERHDKDESSKNGGAHDSCKLDNGSELARKRRA